MRAPLPCIAIASKDRHHCLPRTLDRARASGVPVVICDQSAKAYPAGEGYSVLHRPDIPSLPAARNCLLAHCRAPVLIFIDDDTDLAPEFAQQVQRLSESEPTLSAWGPVMETRSAAQRRCYRLAQWGFARDPRRLTRGPSDAASDALFGCCFAVRRAAALAVGGFDESRRGYSLGEDLEFCRRLHAQGHRLRFARQLRAWHREEASGRADAQARGAAKARFLVWLARRQGGGNPATLLHVAMALAAAASGSGRERAAWQGICAGLLQPGADRWRGPTNNR